LPAASALHKADWLAIELISGFPSGRGLIALSSPNTKLGTRNSELRLRIPADHYRDVLPLAGKRLDIGDHQIRLGLPVAHPLEPAPSLYARVVTIKNFTEPEPFIEAVKRKLDSFGFKGRVELPRDEQGRYRRRIVTIHGKSVVGFSVAVHELNDEASLILQAGAVKVVSPDDGATQWQSIFSRRAMGCGFFNPILAQRER
jgi:CRISPR-associated protein Cas6